MSRFALTNTTRGEIPRVQFERVKNAIVGRSYSLSVVLVGNKRSQELNRRYRGKNKPTNILSFPLDKKTGEIFLALPVLRKETREKGASLSKYITYIFIHGLLHLDGYQHGSTMDQLEERWCRKFRVSRT